MARPSSKPNWTFGNPQVATKAVEPTAEKKVDGWSPTERPTAEHFNWLFRNTSEWINHFDDTNAGATTVRSIYNAILGGTDSTHADLNAVMADNTIPSQDLRILISGPIVFSATQIINRDGVEIYGTPVGTISKGGSTVVGIQINNARVKIRDCRFLNWNETGGKAIQLQSGSKNCLIIENSFHTVATDIEDNGTNNIIANNILEIN